jgi:hypothetical protein
MPLPEFDSGGLARAAARFDEVGMVATAELTPDRRVAYLSERGILILLQRLIFRQSRADISIDTLGIACAAVLAEAELLEEWNESLVPPGEPDVIARLGQAAAEFDAFLSTASPEGESWRVMLRDQYRRPNIRRVVRDEIRARLAAGPSATDPAA